VSGCRVVTLSYYDNNAAAGGMDNLRTSDRFYFYYRADRQLSLILYIMINTNKVAEPVEAIGKRGKVFVVVDNDNDHNNNKSTLSIDYHLFFYLYCINM
jgi:hypothetical protein